MPSNTASYSLISGAVPVTGSMIDPDTTYIQTIFYSFSGLAAGSSAVMGLEARDSAGNWGYIVDLITMTGTSQKNIATFSTPIGNGMRGFIQSVSNGSGYLFLDSFAG